MNLVQNDLTGCRIVGAMTKELGHAGPKHHGVILGQSVIDQHVYIAESVSEGYRVCTFTNFEDRYTANGDIIIEPNDGELENISVAQRAIEELKQGGKGAYNLVLNNCECFVNRAMHNKSVSNQSINTALGIVFFIGLVYVLRKQKR